MTMNAFPECGMTLRDYFAAQTLVGLFACRERTGSEFGYETEPGIALRAYRMADAMLGAREV